MEFMRKDFKSSVQDGTKIKEQVLTNLSTDEALELAINKFNYEYNKKLVELSNASKVVKELELQLQQAKQEEANKKAEVQKLEGKKLSFCTRINNIKG